MHHILFHIFFQLKLPFAKMEMSIQAPKPHILALPLPLQGHINPMMQLCKRLVSRGLRVTIITTGAIADGLVKDKTNSVDTEHIEEYTGEVDATLDDFTSFLERFRLPMMDKLAGLLEKKATSGEPIRVILYDSFIPWALDYVHSLGFRAAVFSTQSCAVANIYNNIFRGKLNVPLEKHSMISLSSMPVMEAKDLPSFVSNPNAYPDVLEGVLSQNRSFEKADWILFNSFDDLECEVASHMRNFYRIKTVGPTIPSIYLDKRLKEDDAYSFNLFQSAKEECMKWLDTKRIASVMYISFGSLAALSQDQMEEIASGITKSNCDFLWTVRATERSKLPNNLMSVAEERGLIVEWCPQLEVLAHEAVGCFLTHCGWNSTLEALSLGVPMVALPLWIDQPTNAKYITDVWQVGSRAKAGEDGIVSRDEVEASIRKVMYGEKANEMKKNALKWKEMAIKAMSHGGSSDLCIQEFVADVE